MISGPDSLTSCALLPSRTRLNRTENENQKRAGSQRPRQTDSRHLQSREPRSLKSHGTTVGDRDAGECRADSESIYGQCCQIAGVELIILRYLLFGIIEKVRHHLATGSGVFD